MVCAGATASGIGAIYGLAKQAGYTTLGIVSDLALADAAWAADVDVVLSVADASWGGWQNATDEAYPHVASPPLAPTSAAWIGVTQLVLALSGGRIAFEEMRSAQARGIPVRYHESVDRDASAGDYAQQMINAHLFKWFVESGCSLVFVLALTFLVIFLTFHSDSPKNSLVDNCGVCGGFGQTCSSDFFRYQSAVFRRDQFW